MKAEKISVKSYCKHSAYLITILLYYMYIYYTYIITIHLLCARNPRCFCSYNTHENHNVSIRLFHIEIPSEILTEEIPKSFLRGILDLNANT